MPFAFSDPKLAKTGTYLDNQTDRAPGPGAYNTNFSTLRKQDVRIHIKTGEAKIASTPGPADYAPKQTNIVREAPSFGLQPRRKTFFDEVPNPTKDIAQYGFNTSTLRRRSRSISGRHHPLTSDATPSPADYNPQANSVGKKQPAYSISVTQRKVFEASKDYKAAPGPADFSFYKRSLKQSGAGTFAKDGLLGKSDKRENPGVGAYQLERQRNGSCGFTFGSRRAVGEHF